MEDLLQSQIRDSCRLALPVGLKELMNDISREVLRSQPENLYQFIANYLEALLITRESLSIACRVCGEVSSCSCQPQLDDELAHVGLSPENVVIAKKIILDHFDKGQVQECNLLAKLTAKIGVNEKQIEKLRAAIQRAFQRHILKGKDLSVSFANLKGSIDSAVEDLDNYSSPSSVSDFYKPTYSSDEFSSQREAQNNGKGKSVLDIVTRVSMGGELDKPMGILGLDKQFYSPDTYSSVNASVSAATLAGSFINLPKMIPYSAHASRCDSILMKSEKSVLSLLKSILYSEDREHHGLLPSRSTNNPIRKSIESRTEQSDVNSEDIDDAIRSVFSQDITEIRDRTPRESRSRAMFKAIHEDLHESSSGGS